MSNALVLDLYELTMAQVYFKSKQNTHATFDLFIRSSHRPFYVACGIDDVLAAIEKLKFSKEDIDYLSELALFEDDFLDYLKEFKFKGQVWAVEEPEIIFAQEPIMRVSANIIEAQIIESIALNKVNLATTLATKAARVVAAARGKAIYDFSLRRTQGVEASLAAAKYSYIAGAKGTSNVLAGFLYKIPVAGTMAHSYVMSFEREIESFQAFAQAFPTKSILLVDTYDVRNGIKSAIRVAKFMKNDGVGLLGIRLDSGNLAEDSKYARSLLDQEGLIDTIIVASGNLDEYKIEELFSKKAPIDAFGVGTNMGCSSDLPYTDVIYKLVEVKSGSSGFMPTMKFSAEKVTLPSRKQVFRSYAANAVMQSDSIGLFEEKIEGKKLMRKVINNGVTLYKEKGIEQKREILAQKMKKIPSRLLNPKSDYTYPVKISNQLSLLTQKLKEQIKKTISDKYVFLDIDTQYDFMDKKGTFHVKQNEHIIANIKMLTACAFKNHILIISSQDTHAKDLPEFKEFPSRCVRGTHFQKKIRESLLKKNKIITNKRQYNSNQLKQFSKDFGQLIIEKNALNVFSNENLANLLEAVFPEKIYVYGISVEDAIKEAVNRLISYGFSVCIVEDAVKEISIKEKEKLFSFWKKRGIEFITTKELIKKTEKEA